MGNCLGSDKESNHQYQEIQKITLEAEDMEVSKNMEIKSLKETNMYLRKENKKLAIKMEEIN